MNVFFSPVVRLGIIGAVLLLAVALGACGDDEGADNSSEGKLEVVTSLPLFADFVKQIGGDRVDVFSLVPTGADPHTYEPPPRDVQRITEADVGFANGLDLEPGTVDIIQPNLPEGIPLILLGNEVAANGVAILPGGEEPGSGEGEEEHAEEGDPHLWMAPGNAIEYARVVRDVLIRVDAEGSSVYEANYEAYVVELKEIEDYVQGKVDGIPSERRKLVTTHDAFGYFAQAFGLEVVGIVAPSPGQEPSPEDVADLARAIRDQAVPAVFVEPQISSEGDVLRQAADDAGVEICTLYSDSLDDRVTNYVDLMRFNADELERCLGDG